MTTDTPAEMRGPRTLVSPPGRPWAWGDMVLGRGGTDECLIPPLPALPEVTVMHAESEFAVEEGKR